MKVIDATQRLKYDINGEVVFNFGKYINANVGETFYKDRQYYHWIQEKDFSIQVKKLSKELLKAYEAKLKAAK
jgi:DNA polymerase III subunit epsilon